MATAIADPATSYARDVVAGRVVACRFVRLACERHLRDLEDGSSRGLRWDLAAAAKAIGFFSFLVHSKGEWAGRPLRLSPWQEFIIGSLFGWKREDGTRRFRMAYTEVPRKNGKSTFAAGVGLYLAFFDGEPGAEVFTAATKREQARIVHDEAIRMVRASSSLRKRISIFKDNLSSDSTNSKYQPLGADANTLDGLNPNGVIVDELHAHKTRDMLDVLETATGARRQPLIFVITTAGVAGGATVCQEMHDYTVKVIEGQVVDDSQFGFIATIDAGDDWKDEGCWAKANPNLGVSCKADDLRRKRDKAVEMPSAQATFRQKHLDEWVQSVEVWLPDDRWMAGDNSKPLDIESLHGRKCYGGLDLANTLDLCAFVLVFPRGGESPIPRRRAKGDDDDEPAKDDDSQAYVLAEVYDVLAWFWCPEDCAMERERSNRVTYRTWIDLGMIQETDGDVTDYDVIREDIKRIGEDYQIKEIAYDPFNATQLATQLVQDGFDIYEFRQNMSNFNEPMTAVEKLSKEGRMRHGGNPVLRWMIGNIYAVRNGTGQVMPSRKKSTDKIDGGVALIQGLSRAMMREGGSVYDRRRVRTIGGPQPAPEPTEDDFRKMFGDDPDDDD